MIPMISNQAIDALTSVIIAVITIVPATFAAFWARDAKKNSAEAKTSSQEAKQNSEEAKVSAAEAAHEVKTNGGMSDPNPNLNDHVKYQTEMTEHILKVVDNLEQEVSAQSQRLDGHIKHSVVMDQAVAELYLEVRPGARNWPSEDDTN